MVQDRNQPESLRHHNWWSSIIFFLLSNFHLDKAKKVFRHPYIPSTTVPALVLHTSGAKCHSPPQVWKRSRSPTSKEAASRKAMVVWCVLRLSVLGCVCVCVQQESDRDWSCWKTVRETEERRCSAGRQMMQEGQRQEAPHCKKCPSVRAIQEHAQSETRYIF